MALQFTPEDIDYRAIVEGMPVLFGHPATVLTQYDGRADEITTGPHKLRWCNAYVPVATNTPLCMSGRTMRVNSSTDHRGVWVTRGLENCTSVDVSYTFYQFANSQVSLKYKGANDDFPTCPSVAVTAR